MCVCACVCEDVLAHRGASTCLCGVYVCVCLYVCVVVFVCVVYVYQCVVCVCQCVCEEVIDRHILMTQ